MYWLILLFDLKFYFWSIIEPNPWVSRSLPQGKSNIFYSSANKEIYLRQYVFNWFFIESNIWQKRWSPFSRYLIIWNHLKKSNQWSIALSLGLSHGASALIQFIVWWSFYIYVHLLTLDPSEIFLKLNHKVHYYHHYPKGIRRGLTPTIGVNHENT